MDYSVDFIKWYAIWASEMKKKKTELSFHSDPQMHTDMKNNNNGNKCEKTKFTLILFYRSH